ncbi:hypothetical protein GDO78_015843 [Eleutherodactylus coqui]|uniref:Uncharacterized protein n=1 Tax=Eleutherodactylus coqui TaxID=57060 RepID=A0A8J6ED70_ELECQ|nr:hypothetical protein GDO78_015843 [Eleutherodactylus coqui]
MASKAFGVVQEKSHNLRSRVILLCPRWEAHFPLRYAKSVMSEHHCVPQYTHTSLHIGDKVFVSMHSTPEASIVHGKGFPIPHPVRIEVFIG